MHNNSSWLPAQIAVVLPHDCARQYRFGFSRAPTPGVDSGRLAVAAVCGSLETGQRNSVQVRSTRHVGVFKTRNRLC